MGPCRAVWRARAAVLWVTLAMVAAGTPLGAQGGLVTEGATWLLVPVGARTVGSGQTLATAEAGSESLWGNPAGVARMTRPEAALHYSKTVAANGSVLALVYPAGKAGVVGVGAQLYDYGAQENTDLLTGQTVGELLPRAVVVAATYAATIGPALRAGVTFKITQLRLDCTGPCGNTGTFNASTSGMDGGAQYQMQRADSLTLGLAVRHLGLRLQVNDNAQSDPLPSRVHLGASARVPAVTKALAGADLRWSAEVVTRTSLNDPAFRVGAELGLQRLLFLRAGYASGLGDATGASIGLGFVRGALAIDFARVAGGFSADAGQPPTYLTVRLQW